MTRNKAKLAAFIFCFSFILIRVLFVPLSDKDKSRNAIHGDAYSDFNTYSAAMYFKDFGFSGTSFLPMWHYNGDRDTSEVGHAYTHYPALPDILAGFYAVIFNTHSSQLLRVVPLLLSMCFFFFIFNFLKNILPDSNAALISALVIVCSNYFLFWADSLHKHLYEELLKWLYVWMLYAYYEPGGKAKLKLFLAACIYLVVTNISFEPIVFLAVTTVGFSWIYTRKIISWENILLLAMPVLGFAIHLLQNYSYVHSWHLVVLDMKAAFDERTLGGSSPLNELHRTINTMDYIRIPYVWLNRIERFFLFPGYAFLVFAILALYRMKKIALKLFQIAFVLLLATLSWSVVMTQHFTVHAFTARHAGLFYGYVIGYGLLEYKGLLIRQWKEGKIIYRIAHVIFIGYVIAMFATQQLVDIFRYGFLYPFNS